MTAKKDHYLSDEKPFLPPFLCSVKYKTALPPLQMPPFVLPVPFDLSLPPDDQINPSEGLSEHVKTATIFANPEKISLGIELCTADPPKPLIGGLEPGWPWSLPPPTRLLWQVDKKDYHFAPLDMVDFDRYARLDAELMKESGKKNANKNNLVVGKQKTQESDKKDIFAVKSKLVPAVEDQLFLVPLEELKRTKGQPSILETIKKRNSLKDKRVQDPTLQKQYSAQTIASLTASNEQLSTGQPTTDAPLHSPSLLTSSPARIEASSPVNPSLEKQRQTIPNVLVLPKSRSEMARAIDQSFQSITTSHLSRLQHPTKPHLTAVRVQSLIPDIFLLSSSTPTGGYVWMQGDQDFAPETILRNHVSSQSATVEASKETYENRKLWSFTRKRTDLGDNSADFLFERDYMISSTTASSSTLLALKVQNEGEENLGTVVVVPVGQQMTVRKCRGTASDALRRLKPHLRIEDQSSLHLDMNDPII